MLQNKVLKTILVMVLALICAVSINLDLDKDIGFQSSLQGNGVVSVVLFFFFAIIINKVLDFEKDKRRIICVSVLSILFSGFMVVGYGIDAYLDLSGVISSFRAFFKVLFAFMGYFIIFYNAITLLFIKILPKIAEVKNKEMKYFTANKRTFFIVMLGLFVLWIPYLLKFYPGIVSPDSMDQIFQSLGLNLLTTHHPIIHTFFISIAMNIGTKLFGSYEAGILIYSIGQMLLTAASFSFIIHYMSKKNIGNIFRIVALAFFAFYPVFPMYAVTMWKDIPFSLSIVFFIICLIEIATNKDNFLNSIKKNILFVISIITMMIFKNTGLYIFILTIPFIFIFAKAYRKRVLIIAVICIVFYSLYNGPFLKIMNIQKGSSSEMLSIPLQQLARTVRDRGSELSEEELEIIHEYIELDDIGESYNPISSDPIKFNVNKKAFEEDKGSFVKIWISLFFKFPVEYVEAFLCNNYGYWYPETTNSIVWPDDHIEYQEVTITQDPKIDGKVINFLSELPENRDLVVISMIFSIGFCFWLILILFIYAIYKKRYNVLLIYIPIIIVWLTCLASPVYCEYRYFYSGFLSITLLLAITVKEEYKVK